MAPAREALPPLFEFVTEIPYTALQQMLDESAPYGIVHAYNKSLYLDDLTDEAIDVVVERLPAQDLADEPAADLSAGRRVRRRRR